MDGLSNIFARNCVVKRISKPEAAAFLDANHRLGSTGGRYHYGMFVFRSTGGNELSLPAGTLVAVSSFSNARKWKKGDAVISSYEWIRYSSLSGTRVVGGMGSMLSHFIDDVHPDDVMTYADLSWPDGGEVYAVLGFNLEAVVEKAGFRCRKFRYMVNP